MEDNELTQALERLIAGQSSQEDVAALRAAYAGGRITLAGGVRSVTIGGSAQNVTIQTGDTIYQISAEQWRQLHPRYHPPPPPPEGELPEPGDLPPGYRMPFERNPAFTGREQDLLQLARALLYAPQPGQAQGIVGSRRAAAATGMGGIGKSQLAVEFCYRYGRFFRGVHWLQANLDLRAEIAGCGGAMRLPGWPETTDEQVQATLRAWQDQTPHLLVLDNVEDIALLKRWLPEMGSCRVLVTARMGRWPATVNIQAHPLDVLARDESLRLLRRLAPRLESAPEADLQRLAERFGDLPLGLHIVGSYLAVNEALTIAGYLDWLEEIGGAIAQERLPAWLGDDPTHYERNLAAAFQASLEQLQGGQAVDEAARRIFLGCGYCAANTPIPAPLLARLAASGDEKTAPAVGLALARLYGLGLLESAEGGASIHPLLAEFAREVDQEQARSVLPRLVMGLAILAKLANDAKQPAPFLPLRAHVRAVAEQVEASAPGLAPALWTNLGYHLRMVAEYEAARAAYERALAIDEQDLGADHPQVATLVNNLGSVLRAQGDLEGARVAFQRALAIAERVYGPEHPTVAIRVNNLGSVLRAQGDLAGARAAFERALAIDEQHLGADHPEVATLVNNLGDVLYAQGDLEGARAAFERALAIDERVYGPEHPAVAIRVNNLGSVLRAQGDPLGARAAYERALAILEARLPEGHPDIETVRANLRALE